MRKNYLGHIFFNLTIILIAFIIFVFFDINISKANQILNNSNFENTVKLITIESNNSFSNKIDYDYKNIIPMEWSTNHYIDYNEFNEITNPNIVRLNNSNEIEISFYSLKNAYYRFEIPKFILSRNISLKKTYIQIYNEGILIPSYLGPSNISFTEIENSNFIASWFYGLNPPIGDYQAVLFINNKPLITNNFKIIQREPVKFNRMMTFINLEWNQAITNRNIYNHNNEKVKFINGLKDWMDYGEIDAFLTLSGETTGWGNITPEKPWENYPIKNLQIIAEELHNSGKKVGAYIMCFYTPQNGWNKAGYKPAMGVYYDEQSDSFNVNTGKFISFNDKKRFNDIVELARYFNSLPYVDYIGFDFVRFGELIGYENADEFVKDMNITVPDNWKDYNINDQIIWLGQKLWHNSTGSISQKWKVWIAHKTADFIYRVRKEANLTKPIWIFSLGWNHGSEHGQDPYFFQDAGVFSDFVMLYEATPDMIEAMKKSWSEYVDNSDLNYIPGNQIDADLLKSEYNNNPVEEYYQRLNSGVDYATYLSKGIFIHDISRAFWGRKGTYPYNEWLISGFSSASYARMRNNEIPYNINIDTNQINSKFENVISIPVSIEFKKDKLSELNGKSLYLEVIGNNSIKKIDISEKTNIILVVNIGHREQANRYFALRSKIEGYPAYFVFGYINNKKLITITKVSKVIKDL